MGDSFHKVRVADLEGWLLKVKAEGNGRSGILGILAGGATKRWFRVAALPNSKGGELALCYFRNKTDRDSAAKGWIYLDDIISISEDKDTFSVETASRIMVIQAQTRAEHRLWLQGIAERAPNATLRNITTALVIPEEPMTQPSPPPSVHSKSNSKYAVDDYGEESPSSLSDRSIAQSPVLRLSSQKKSSVPTTTDELETDQVSMVMKKDEYKPSHEPSFEDRRKHGSLLYEREDHRLANQQGSYVGKGGVSARLQDHIRRESEEKVGDARAVSVSQNSSRASSKKGSLLQQGGLFMTRNEFSFESKASDDVSQVVAIETEYTKRYTKYLDDDSDSDEEKEVVTERMPSSSELSSVVRLNSDDDKEEKKIKMLLPSKTPHSSPLVGGHRRKGAAVESECSDGSDDERSSEGLNVRAVSFEKNAGKPPRPRQSLPSGMPSHRSESKEHEGSVVPPQRGAGVTTDVNWLHDDFDDD